MLNVKWSIEPSIVFYQLQPYQQSTTILISTTSTRVFRSTAIPRFSAFGLGDVHGRRFTMSDKDVNDLSKKKFLDTSLIDFLAQTCLKSVSTDKSTLFISPVLFLSGIAVV